MRNPKERTLLIFLIIFFLFVISFPVLLGFNSQDGVVFGGYAFNPTDNNTYLAKMRQGYDGHWLYTLDYTPDPGEGAFINGYYLFLGHIGRLTGIPLLIIQHLARLAGAVCLLLVLYRLANLLFEETRPRGLVFTLAAFGGGLGWLASFTGAITSDLWVAEGFPFLASFANAHFPLGLALQVGLLLPLSNALDTKMAAKVFLAALAAAVISPFSIPVVLLVLGGQLLWQWREQQPIKTDLTRLLLTGLGGGPLLVYDYITVKTHPVLKLWDAQNITTSPPWWDILVSFSPLLILAFFGARYAWKNRSEGWQIMLVWASLCLVLVYIPFSLQRRFIIGLFIPIAMLGVLGLETWLNKARRGKTWIISGVVIFSLLTSALSVMSSVFGVLTHNQLMFLSQSEADGLAWIDENTTADALVLASPGLGNFIPAQTGRRVLYGHPFETVNAEFWEAAVDGFFAGESSLDFVSENNVDYIFVGSRERALGERDDMDTYPIVYQNSDVIIYGVGN